MRAKILGAAIVLLLGAALLFLLLPSRNALPFLAWGKRGREIPGTFDHPRCVAIRADGTLTVLDLTGRLQRFTPDGVYLDEAHMPDVTIGRPQGIAATPEGGILVADTHYNQLLRFSPSGEVTQTFGRPAASPDEAETGELYWPCAVAVAADGTVYSAEYGGHDRIQKWAADGTWLAAWGRMGTGEGEFMRPSGLALDGEGRLFVADAANHRVQAFTEDGEFLWMFGGGPGGAGVVELNESGEPVDAEAAAAPPEGRLRYPYDLALDRRGTLHVVEFGAHRVQAFTREGKWLGAWGGKGRGADGLFLPWGVTATADGAVYVADTYNNRVVRLPVIFPAGAGVPPVSNYAGAKVEERE